MIDSNVQNTLRASLEAGKKFPIELSKVWKALGYVQYRTVVNHIKNYLTEGEEYITICSAQLRKNTSKSRTHDEYFLNGFAFDYIATTAQTPEGKECFRFYHGLKLEKQSRLDFLLSDTPTPAPIAPPIGPLPEENRLYTLDEVQAVVNYHLRNGKPVYLTRVIKRDYIEGEGYFKGPDGSMMIAFKTLCMLSAVGRSKRGTNIDLLPDEATVRVKDLIKSIEDSKMNRRLGRKKTLHPDSPYQDVPLFDTGSF